MKLKDINNYIIYILLILMLVGCKSTKPTNNDVLGMRYNSNSGTFYEDSWDKFINGIKNGTVVFSWTKAIFTYIISNVEIFDCRPEEQDTELLDRIGVVIYIFRWRY